MKFPRSHRWLLYFHTIRYLKPSQIFWRVWRRVPASGIRESSPVPSQRRANGQLVAIPHRPRTMVAADTFRFLNEEHRLAAAADWNNPHWEALWIYNLHYFDDLCAEGAAQRRTWHEALIARWISENRVGRGVGWDPYPLSLRVVNWIKWALAGGELTDDAIQSLVLQARYLPPRVEWHLLGNHVLANAKALVYAGCFFEGAEPQAWLRDGLKILHRQLAEQVLPDGGHFERSPMYHAIVLEDVLDLIRLARSFPGVLLDDEVPALQEAARRMLGWARIMTHPDGGIAFFNDAALGIAPSVAQLGDDAARLGIEVPRDEGSGLTCLGPSGYVRLAQGPFTVLFDAAPVGPGYIPGHAHADTLAFELSHGLQRVICNSGTSRYGRSAVRRWERSTAAHNTIEIDGENSSEVWDGFRVARRAHPVGLNCEQEADTLRVACAHDGYARLRGRPMHRRAIEISDSVVRWTDEVTGAGVHRVVGRIPLHPSVRAEQVSASAWKLALPSGESLSLSIEGIVELAVEEGRYAPEFGLTLERQVVVWVTERPLPVAVSLRLAAR